MTAPEVIASFVAATRRRRVDAGKPDLIEAEAVYRLLDGLLLRGVIADDRTVA